MTRITSVISGTPRIRICLRRTTTPSSRLRQTPERRTGLWTPESRLQRLTVRIEAEPANAALHIERGKLHYRRASWGDALNDFNRALALDKEHTEARQYVEMVQEILQFRYTDLYNP